MLLAHCFITTNMCLTTVSLFLIVLSAYQTRANEATSNQSIIGRPFEAEDIMIGQFNKLHVVVPSNFCSSISVHYAHIIPKGDGTYRVPHSRIYMDGKKCGKLADNATASELWLDDHMELIPADFLFNETIAREKSSQAAYFKLNDGRVLTKGFYDFSMGEVELQGRNLQSWIGFERYSNRTCGDNNTGYAIIRRESFIFFGKNDDVRINITALFPNITTGSNVILSRYHPYHLTFTKVSRTEPEVVCPQVFSDVLAGGRAGNVRKCFPGSAVVALPEGRQRTMSSLRIGDRVMDSFDSFSEVFMFSHRDQSGKVFEYITLYGSNSTTLSLSPGHFLITNDGLRAAEDLHVGDAVLSGKGETMRIISREYSYQSGLFNPHTFSGKLLVNGVLVSCYTTAIDPNTAHALLAPIRLMYRIYGVNAMMIAILEDAVTRGIREIAKSRLSAASTLMSGSV